MSPEKFSFRLQHEAVGQVLVNRNAGSRILTKINTKISAGRIVKLHLCFSFSLPPSQNCSCLSSIALICFKCFRLHFELAQKHIQKPSRNITQGGVHPDAFAGWLHGGGMSSGVFSVKKYRAWLKSFECKSRGESGDGAATGLSDVLPDMSCSAGWRGVAAQSILKKATLALQAGPLHSSQRKEAGRQKEHHQGPALQISKNAIIKPRINESVDFHSHGGLSGRSVVALKSSILFKEPIL